MRNIFVTIKKNSFLTKPRTQSVQWPIILTLAAFLLGANSMNSISALTLQEDSTKPEVSMQTIYYEINGATVDELRSQMQKLGPVDQSGRHYNGYTDWHVRWSHNCQSLDDTYGIGSIEVKVEVKLTLPKWEASSDVAGELVNKWDVYLRALQAHEDGHKDIAIEAGVEIIRRLKVLGSFASCEELSEVVNSAGQGILEEYRRKETLYDKETKHGASQGAKLQ